MAGLPEPSAPPSQHWAPAPALLLWWVLLPTKAEAVFAIKNVLLAENRLPTRACAHGENGTVSDPGPVSDQDGRNHCQQVLWCTHPGGVETSSRVEIATSRVPIPAHTLRRELG